jgi:serine/threonine protein phosphatase PrpC
MEDSHAAVLDLKPTTDEKENTPTPPDKRLAYFGVYDGHGGDKVAQFAGESTHKIVAKQDAFSTGDIEQALKDGFLATDRAILNGELAVTALHFTGAHPLQIQSTKRKSLAAPHPSGSYQETRSG